MAGSAGTPSDPRGLPPTGVVDVQVAVLDNDRSGREFLRRKSARTTRHSRKSAAHTASRQDAPVIFTTDTPGVRDAPASLDEPVGGDP
ncbi:hypothetical protein AB4305_33105 [Nocardia sp. 2YAB30]|uniref:hypothetical protein n=1 Tax=unclassified Nocardia TaxID=2637762 RepID=UPI003F9D509B